MFYLLSQRVQSPNKFEITQTVKCSFFSSFPCPFVPSFLSSFLLSILSFVYSCLCYFVFRSFVISFSCSLFFFFVLSFFCSFLLSFLRFDRFFATKFTFCQYTHFTSLSLQLFLDNLESFINHVESVNFINLFLTDLKYVLFYPIRVRLTVMLKVTSTLTYSLVFVFFFFVVYNCECNVTVMLGSESRDCAIKLFEVCTFECQALRENGRPHEITERTVSSLGVEPTTPGLDYYCPTELQGEM